MTTYESCGKQKDWRSFAKALFRFPFPFDVSDPEESVRCRVEEYVRSHYPPGLYDQLLTLAGRRYQQHENVTERTESFNDLIYRTGVCDVIAPHVLLRSRDTLTFLLSRFSKEKKGFTIADFGSGDGRIDIGLALCLPQVECLYAIDEIPSAAERLSLNIDKIEDPLKKGRVRKTIIPVVGNYLSPEIQENLRKAEPVGFDVSLALYPEQSIYTLLPVAAQMTQTEGRFVVAGDFDTYERHSAPLPSAFVDGAIQMIDRQQKEIGKIAGVRLRIAETFEYPGLEKLVIISTGRKVRKQRK